MRELVRRPPSEVGLDRLPPVSLVGKGFAGDADRDELARWLVARDAASLPFDLLPFSALVEQEGKEKQDAGGGDRLPKLARVDPGVNALQRTEFGADEVEHAHSGKNASLDPAVWPVRPPPSPSRTPGWRRRRCDTR